MSKNKNKDVKANFNVSNKNIEEESPNERGEEPQHYKSLKSHCDTISQLVFNPNK